MQTFRFGFNFLSFLFLLSSVDSFKYQEENGDWGNMRLGVHQVDSDMSSYNPGNQTAVIMNKILEEHHNSDAVDHDDLEEEYHNHRVTQFLDRISNPVEVASELDSAAKYLIRHKEEQIKNGSDNEAAAAAVELTRVLDGFVFLNNMYDSVVRPAAGADSPTVVSVDMFVYPWFNIDEEKNEMTVTVTLIQNWTDPRLEYRSRVTENSAIPFVTLTSYMHLIEMWFPDTCLYNEKRRDISASPSDFIRVSELGKVSREQRMSVTLNCPFSQRETFPFDTVTCSLRLTSFSWSKRQVVYRWAKESSQDYSYNTMESNGFRMTTMIRSETDFERRGLKFGNASSGLIVDFVLQREVTPFVMKIFLPLALFCVISMVGLVQAIGAEIGAALSYFVFGVMNIFMGVSFTGGRFVWGSERTALDLYYVLSVVTVLVTGLVNIFRLSTSQRDDEKRGDEGEEFEMRGSDTGGNLSALGAGNLEPGSDNGVSGNACGTAGRVLKVILKRGRQAGRVICRRVNDSSSLIVVGAFICWNLWFWATNFF